MKTRIVIIIGLVALASLRASFAKEAVNRPYVQSGRDGIFYARCIPHDTTGSVGFTDIYRVQKEHDQLVDRYDWFTKRGVVLGWSPIVGKVAVLAIHNDAPTSLDNQVEISFHLGGKFLKSWTTTDLKRLGAEVGVSRPGGERAVFQIVGCEQVPGTNEYVFTLQFAKDKKVSFDILTGDQYHK